MKNSFGHNVTVTLFGESHGAGIGAVLDGIAPGIPVDEEDIRLQLSLRRPQNALSTARQEPDTFTILSGVFEGHTTGTPIAITIPNTDTRSRDYGDTRWKMRPGHADYTAYCKYHGFEDYRGGGHFSGRITAALVAVGAIAKQALVNRGIAIGTHISQCAGISDRCFNELTADALALQTASFPTLDESAGKAMQTAITAAREAGNSVGGVLQTVVTGMPGGVGEPWFDTMESLLAHALFSIPGIKGVEFGSGFGFASMRGSEANDSFYLDENNAVQTTTNHNGGINGGITNGMPLLFQCAVKPTPSIALEQDTVDISASDNCKLTIHGRHDPAIIHRAKVVVDSITALTLCDVLATHYGTDWLRG